MKLKRIIVFVFAILGALGLVSLVMASTKTSSLERSGNLRFSMVLPYRLPRLD